MERLVILVGESAARAIAGARLAAGRLEPWEGESPDPGAWASGSAEVLRALGDGAGEMPGEVPGEVHVAVPGEVHVAVPQGSRRARSGVVVPHLLSGDIPRGGLLRVGPGVLCLSPAHLFLWECARSRSLSERLMLGMELCGTYAHEVCGRRAGPIGCGLEPVATRAQIEGYLGLMAGRYGVEKARLALGWVIDGAASPREAALALMQHLPPRLGGYGYPTPELNPRIEVPAALRDVVFRDTFVPDLYWERFALDVEYDSREHHLRPRKVRADKRRLRDIQALGVRVMPVTDQTVDHFDEFDQMEMQIGLHMEGYLGRSMTRHLARLRDPFLRMQRRDRLYDLLPPYDDL